MSSRGAPVDLVGHWAEYVDGTCEDNEIARIRASVNRQMPYGDANWQMKICKALGLESEKKKQGRPKKGNDDEKK